MHTIDYHTTRYLLSQLGVFDLDTMVIASADGCYVWDVHGSRYLDVMGGYWVAALGYADREILQTLTEASSTLSFWHNFETTHTFAIRYSEALMSRLPDELRGKLLFANTGSGAMENALRLASAWAQAQAQRLKVAYLDRAYHGSTFLTQQASPWNDWPRSVHVEPQSFISIPTPHDSASCQRSLHILRATFSDLSCPINTIITEPVLGVGGMIVPPKEFFVGLRRLCNDFNVLWISDEISTGFGATGTLFAFEPWGVLPDVLVLGKKLAAGYFPMSCAVVSERVASSILMVGDFHHGYSTSAHPVGCAIASVVLQRFGSDELLHHAKERGIQLRSGLEAIACTGHDLGAVNGLGLMLSLETRNSRQARLIADELRRRGIYELPEGKYLTFCPPLIISKEQIDFLLSELSGAIRSVS